MAARVAAVGAARRIPLRLLAAAERTFATDATLGRLPLRADRPPPAWSVFVRAVFVDGELGILWWVLLASLVLLLPRVGKGGLGWALAALAVAFAETMAARSGSIPSSRSTTRRSTARSCPVSAAAAVWLAWLLADACRPVTAAVPPAPPSRPEA